MIFSFYRFVDQALLSESIRLVKPSHHWPQLNQMPPNRERLEREVVAGAYAVGIAASFFLPWVAACIYAFVALMWLIPDRRSERVVDESKPARQG